MMKKASETIYWDALNFGSKNFYLATTGKGILIIKLDPSYESFADFVKKRVPNPVLVQDPQRLEECSRQLTEYFEGKRTVFDLPFDLRGTAFQVAVWEALARVPFGKTCSYADIAREIENEKAVRAVGNACGLNPLIVVVPCHRILGKDGGLHGFSAVGGLTTKEEFLQHERNGVKNSF